MKTYPYQDGGRLIQLVEKRELDQLLERLAEARESHLAASARDVQTIQRQAILLERLADAHRKISDKTIWPDTMRELARDALAAYESTNPELIPKPIDEAIKRMEAVPALELNKLHFDLFDYGNFNDIEAIRACLIQAAKGEQP
jgi:hypothetical protein